jgi:hypothetical protein
MAGDERLTRYPAAESIQSCWMCGIRMPAHRMVPDGGSACADIRWYCQDMRGCVERWTAGRARLSHMHQDTLEAPQAGGVKRPPRGNRRASAAKAGQVSRGSS